MRHSFPIDFYFNYNKKFGFAVIAIDNGHLNPPYDDLHSANRMALMTEAAVNLAAAMRIGQQQQQQQQQNQHQQNNQQNSQQQHQV